MLIFVLKTEQIYSRNNFETLQKNSKVTFPYKNDMNYERLKSNIYIYIYIYIYKELQHDAY
jgi:hypothetical protein